MKVKVLQQFLLSLVGPLRAVANSDALPTQLENACQTFEPFGDKDVGEFAEFLRHAQDYEREGHWPALRPSISGELVDEPTPGEYAARVQGFLKRRVSTGSPIPGEVLAELNKLDGRLTPAQREGIALELGVSQPSNKKKQAINQILQHLTGQSAGVKSKATRASATLDTAALQSQAQRLKQIAGTAVAKAAFEELKNDKTMSAASLRSLAEALGLSVGPKSRKPEILRAIDIFLVSRRDADAPLFVELAPRGDQFERYVEIVKALKAKADVPRSPVDEIEAELRSLERQINRDEAVAVVKRLGIVAPVSSKQEALEAIRRRVFEGKRAQETIAY